MGRVDDLENAVRDLNTALNTERTDRVNAQNAVEKQLQQLGGLLTDNSEGGQYALKYLNDLDAEYTAKEHMAQEAIRDFNDFLKLPESANTFLMVWDAAFSALATVVPFLRLTSFAKIEEEAEKEVRAAKAFMKTPALAARVTLATAQGHEIADVVAKTNDVRDKVGKATESSGGRKPADGDKVRVRQLIQESNQAHQALDSALDALSSEFRARIQSVLYSVPYASKGTLLDMAKRLLPPLPHYYTDDELEDVGLQYKWQMLKEWAGPKYNNVKIITVINGPGGNTSSIDGLNDNQIDQIMKWFGLRSPRSRYFTAPVCWKISLVLYHWGVKEQKTVVPEFRNKHQTGWAAN